MSTDYWYPVLKAAKLKKKPIRVVVNGDALVVFRTKDGLGCLRDMCPHRAASFSGGAVVDDTVQCPYHGWQFDRQGQCAHIPLLEGERPKYRVPSWDIREVSGLIFVCRDAQKAPPIQQPMWDDQPKVSCILESDATTTLVDAVENVLDPIHTLFVHKGLIRGGSSSRTEVKLSARVKDGQVIMRYKGEDQQDGLLSRLLEGERSHAINRFAMPGVVSLEYWAPQKLNLVTTLYFTPVSENTFKGFAIMTGPKQGGFGYIKALLFLAIMRRVINQDLEIMKDAHQNWVAAGRPRHANSPLDILRPMIEHVAQGNTNPIPEQSITLRL
jgi:phenylpropionate dioxygenase-like ring-hydroxylating dioxygenase large terminal subunit